MILAAELSAPSEMGDVLVAFLSIIFEGGPYILLGTLLSGLIAAFLPQGLLERVLPKSRVLATISAGFLGLVFPVCECAIVPVIRRLVQKGLPVSCAVTYMLAAPIVNPIVAVSTLTAFKEFQGLSFATAGNASMTIARLSLGWLVAVIVGLVILRFKSSQILKDSVVEQIDSAAATAAAGHTPPAAFNAKLVHAMRTAMRDFLDTAMYFAIGVIITSIFNTRIDQSILTGVAGNEYLALPTMMGIAMVLSLCSTSDAFIAAPMATFSMAAKLAFLVFGPMMDIKLLFMYSSVFKRKVVLGLLVGLFVLIGSLSVPWMGLIEKLKADKKPVPAAAMNQESKT